MMLSSLLAASSGGGASGGGGGGGVAARDAVLAEVAADITARVPQPFDIEAVRFKYPVDYYESMNTVLCQELVRFNRLLEVRAYVCVCVGVCVCGGGSVGSPRCYLGW